MGRGDVDAKLYNWIVIRSSVIEGKISSILVLGYIEIAYVLLFQVVAGVAVVDVVDADVDVEVIVVCFYLYIHLIQTYSFVLDLCVLECLNHR